MKKVFLCLFLSIGIVAVGLGQDADKKKLIKEALSAAIPSISDNATVVDWEENVLREGSNGWTCMPTPPDYPPGTMPMCLDAQWLPWAQAWIGKTDPNVEGIGFAYMLQGDAGGSNTDPYATEPTDDNEWIEEGPPHLMLLVPNLADLDNLPTDPYNGGPWVMWKGTKYAHVMIPTVGLDQ